MVLNAHRNHGEKGWGGGGLFGGESKIINLSLHCHHQNDFCIMAGSNESHLNIS